MNKDDLYTDTLNKVIDFGHEEIKGETVVERLTFNNSVLWYYIRFMLFNRVRTAKNEAQGSKKSKHSTLGLKLRFLLIFISRALKGAFQKLPERKHWLMVNPNALSKMLDINSKNEIIGDGYLEYLTRKVSVDKRFALVSEFYPPKFESGVTHLKTRSFDAVFEINLEWYMLKKLFLPSTWMVLYKTKRALKHALQSIEKYSTNPLAKELKHYERLMLFAIFRELVFEQLILNKKPTSVSGTNEHDTKLKSLMEPAKRLGIKTCGIQHGIIHKQHAHYIFKEIDMKYRPTPQKMLVWGKQAKQVLTADSTYQKGSVKVVGQIRTDLIPALKKSTEKESYILFASQIYHAVDKEIESQIVKDILRFSAEHPQEKIVIKPHPRQAKVAEFLKSHETPRVKYNYEIVYDDLYQMLNRSKLVITHNSTVGGEAIYFNKPLILMDYSKDDLANFVSEGIGIPVYNYHELKSAANTVKDWNGNLQNCRNKFIDSRVYKIDGAVCDRIIDEIVT